jgi:hypothetical protein
VADEENSTWVTRDEREIPLDEMYLQHIGNAQAKLRDWLKGESDPQMRAELKGWQRKFRREVNRRRREWLLSRKQTKK